MERSARVKNSLVYGTFTIGTTADLETFYNLFVRTGSSSQRTLDHYIVSKTV